MNDGGRGCELSELVWFQDKLLTVDDHTGILFELTGVDDKKKRTHAIPQNIIMEGNGDSAIGQRTSGRRSRTRNFTWAAMGASTKHASGSRSTKHTLASATIASEDFETTTVVDIGKPMTPQRGFSSFKFVPNTNDSMMLAIKTVEIGDQQNVFLTVFDIHGNVLLYDVEIQGNHKYEGIAFLHH